MSHTESLQFYEFSKPDLSSVLWHKLPSDAQNERRNGVTRFVRWCKSVFPTIPAPRSTVSVIVDSGLEIRCAHCLSGCVVLARPANRARSWSFRLFPKAETQNRSNNPRESKSGQGEKVLSFGFFRCHVERSVFSAAWWRASAFVSPDCY